MHMKTLTALALSAALLAAGVARADTAIYKWVDDQGKVHYSTEPHGAKAQQLGIQNTSTPHAGTDVTPVPGAASAAAAANDAALVQSQPTDSPTCKTARDNLYKYLHADTLYTTDDQGKKVKLSADDQKRALDGARSYVAMVCKGGGA